MLTFCLSDRRATRGHVRTLPRRENHTDLGPQALQAEDRPPRTHGRGLLRRLRRGQARQRRERSHRQNVRPCSFLGLRPPSLLVIQ